MGTRRRCLRQALGLLAIGLAGGCASGGGNERSDAAIFGEQCQPGGSFSLDGTRAAVLGMLNVHVNASGLVEVDTTAELLIALDVVQHGTEVEVVASACGIQIPEIPIAGQPQPIIFEVPPETIGSVAGVHGNGTLTSASATCATFETDVFTLALGAILDPIQTANLPTAADDGSFPFCAPTVATSCALAIGVNCACDQEGDGKGGITLLAHNVPAVNLDQVYVTLRTLFSLKGDVYSSDLIVGEVQAGIELGILGCRLEGGAPCNGGQVGAVKNLNPQITQQTGNASTFRAVRVEAGTTCADILKRRDELFPR